MWQGFFKPFLVGSSTFGMLGLFAYAIGNWLWFQMLMVMGLLIFMAWIFGVFILTETRDNPNDLW